MTATLKRRKTRDISCSRYGHAKDTEVYRPYNRDGELYTTEYGFGFVRPQGRQPDDGIFRRNYKWNERNLLSESSDSAYTVQYRYGADGQRAIKYVMNTGKATLYYNNMWQISDATLNKVQSKHIYVGETRIATKSATHKNDNTQEEQRRIYFYHSDHLGSAQTVTNYEGKIHERLEYTPYGELWIDYRNPDLPGDSTPFRFTGKEMDQETGLYYYGARYLDPRTSRWISSDPAMGEYVAGSKRGNGGIYNAINLHCFAYAGNNPIIFIDPDGRDFGSFMKNLKGKAATAAETVKDKVVGAAQTVANTAEAAVNSKPVQAVRSAVNSGNHQVEKSLASKKENGTKAFWAKAAADTRLSEGQLNVNAQIGCVSYAPEETKLFESSNGNVSLSFEGSITSLTAGGFLGLKDSLLGFEGSATLVEWSGSLNLDVYGHKVKYGGKIGIGAGIGKSWGMLGLKTKKGGVIAGETHLQIIPKLGEQ